ncbi:hypothetical protein, partial [Mycobacterium sp.]|uniref:hypothetical protein n=1 Tax=Mycobacterium sp. TaxID=1785 RepID=UPI003BAEFFDE
MRETEAEGRRAPHVVDEVGLAQHPALRSDEHQTVRSGLSERLEVFADGRADRLGDRDGAPAGLGLGRAEVTHPAGQLGDRDPDRDGASGQVDVAAGQGGQLPHSQRAE